MAGVTTVSGLVSGMKTDDIIAKLLELERRPIVAYQARCEALRAEGRPTLPSTLALERSINPFVRCSEPALAASARAHGARSDDPVEVFAALREWKNNYR